MKPMVKQIRRRRFGIASKICSFKPLLYVSIISNKDIIIFILLALSMCRLYGKSRRSADTCEFPKPANIWNPKYPRRENVLESSVECKVPPSKYCWPGQQAAVGQMTCQHIRIFLIRFLSIGKYFNVLDYNVL